MIVLRDKVINYMAGEMPVLENPSPDELNDLWRSMHKSGTIRFIAVAKTKRLYAFNGDDYTHTDGVRYIEALRGIKGIGGFINNPPDIFTGNGPLKNGKIELWDSDVFSSHDYAAEKLEKAIALDWSFADRYLSGPVQRGMAALEGPSVIARFLIHELEAPGRHH